MRIKTTAAYILCLSLLLSAFSGCRQNDPGSTEDPHAPKDHYKLTWSSVSLEEGEIRGGSQADKTAAYYIIGSVDDTGSYYQRLYRLPHGSHTPELFLSSQNGDPIGDLFEGIDGDYWMNVNQVTSRNEEGLGFVSSFCYRLSPEGKVKQEWVLGENIPLTNTARENADYRMATDPGGIPYWAHYDEILWAPEGDVDHLQRITLQCPPNFTIKGFLPDGSPVVSYRNDNRPSSAFCFAAVDLSTGAVGQVIAKADQRGDRLYCGLAADTPLIKEEDGRYISRLTPEGDWELLLDLADFGLEDAVFDISVLADGVILLVEEQTYGWDFGYLTPCTAAEAAATLTVAGFGLDSVKEMARRYNRTQSETIILTQEYMTGAGYSAADVTRLNTDLLAGKTPDILCVDNYLSARALIAQNALLDLRPYVERDLGSDWFTKGVPDKFTVKGGVYQLPVAFTLDTMIADGDLVGSAPLTLERIDELADTYPDTPLFYSEFMRERLLTCMETGYMDHFVDWETGTCHFEKDAFKRLLILAASLPTMDEVMKSWERGGEIVSSINSLKEGRILLSETNISNMHQYAKEYRLMGDRTVYPGYPSPDGRGSILRGINVFAVMTGCRDKEGAWDFVKWTCANGLTLLREQLYSEELPYFPVNAEAFRREAAACELTDADLTGLLDLIDRAVSAVAYDAEIAAVIEEEAGKFFSGKCSVEQAAAAIQSRVSIYVSEQS